MSFAIVLTIAAIAIATLADMPAAPNSRELPKIGSAGGLRG